jgi:hypothetical protein
LIPIEVEAHYLETKESERLSGATANWNGFERRRSLREHFACASGDF